MARCEIKRTKLSTFCIEIRRKIGHFNSAVFRRVKDKGRKKRMKKKCEAKNRRFGKLQISRIIFVPYFFKNDPRRSRGDDYWWRIGKKN